MLNLLSYAALPYTEYPLRMLKYEIQTEITEYDANGRDGACRKLSICENVKKCLRILTNEPPHEKTNNLQRISRDYCEFAQDCIRKENSVYMGEQ